MININAYTEKLTERLTSGLKDEIMDHLDDNLEYIIHDVIIDEIRNCLTQAVIEARGDVRNEVSVDKPDFSKNDNEPLEKKVRRICKESNAVAFITVVMDDERCIADLNGTGINLIYMIRKIISSLTQDTNMSKSSIIAMLNAPVDPPIILDK